MPVDTEAQARVDGLGLRERKKQATREALSSAALRLAVARGLENVRVEEIAAEAGVSPRTFNNYFSSKYEAIISRHAHRIGVAARLLRERPADEPLWQAVTHAALEVFSGSAEEADRSGEAPPPRHWTEGVRRLLSEPALRNEMLKPVKELGELEQVIAERTGTDPTRDLYPKLVVGALMTAQATANELWLRADPPVPLTALLREALDLIGAGLPDPPRPAARTRKTGQTE